MSAEPPWRSNCLLYALRQWRARGGYLIVRRSRWGWWPHFLWAPDLGDLPVEHFAPVTPRTDLRFPPLIFNGTVRTRDH